MDKYGRESQTEGEYVMVCEKAASQSVLVKRIIFGILDDKQGAEG